MKYVLLILLITGIFNFTFAQTNGPKEVTPQKLQIIKAEVEKTVPAFKKKIERNSRFAPGNIRFNAEIEFMVDTFRAERVYEKVSNINYTTQGMANATYLRGNDYDKLLNKYYNRLLKLLKSDDKKVLINAQRAWIAYRDSESKLISMLRKEEYSGGGTIQTNTTAYRYTEIVEKRAIALGQYYVNAIELK